MRPQFLDLAVHPNLQEVSRLRYLGTELEATAIRVVVLRHRQLRNPHRN